MVRVQTETPGERRRVPSLGPHRSLLEQREKEKHQTSSIVFLRGLPSWVFLQIKIQKSVEP